MQSDVDDIVASVTWPGGRDARSCRIAVLSGAGSTGEGASFEALLNTAVGDILLRPIRWAQLLQDLQLCIRDSSATSFITTAIGTKADQLIYNVLKHTPPCELLPPAPPRHRGATGRLSRTL